jgi:hypothetical protein
MQEGSPTSSKHLHTTMTADAFKDTHATTYLDDESIDAGTDITSPHLTYTMHDHNVTLSTFSATTYG